MKLPKYTFLTQNQTIHSSRVFHLNCDKTKHSLKYRNTVGRPYLYTILVIEISILLVSELDDQKFSKFASGIDSIHTG